MHRWCLPIWGMDHRQYQDHSNRSQFLWRAWCGIWHRSCAERGGQNSIPHSEHSMGVLSLHLHLLSAMWLFVLAKACYIMSHELMSVSYTCLWRYLGSCGYGGAAVLWLVLFLPLQLPLEENPFKSTMNSAQALLNDTHCLQHTNFKCPTISFLVNLFLQNT